MAITAIKEPNGFGRRKTLPERAANEGNAREGGAAEGAVCGRGVLVEAGR